MSLNRDCIGREYTQFEEPAITLESVRAYAEAINQKEDASVVHPLYGFCLSFGALTAAILDGDLEADLLRLVHRTQKVISHAPLQIGQDVKATSTISKIVEDESGSSLTVEVQLHEKTSGVLLQSHESEQFIRTRARHKKRIVEDTANRHDNTLALTIDKDQSERYAKASGDPNPIHTDKSFAQMAGFPDRILHGMCTLAMTTSAIALDANKSLNDIREVGGRFVKPVYMGDKLSIAYAQDAESRAYHFACRNPKEIPCIKSGFVHFMT